MRRLKRFIARPTAERVLLLRAGFIVAAVRAALWLLPLDPVRRAAVKITRNSSVRYSSDLLIWSVSTVSRYIPRATCLTQALTAHALLTASGYASHIEIGVARGESQRFEAHAWLVQNDRIVLGGSDAARYTPLLKLPETVEEEA